MSDEKPAVPTIGRQVHFFLAVKRYQSPVGRFGPYAATVENVPIAPIHGAETAVDLRALARAQDLFFEGVPHKSQAAPDALMWWEWPPRV